MSDHRTEDRATLPDRLRTYGIAIGHEAADEIERLRSVLHAARHLEDMLSESHPRLTNALATYYEATSPVKACDSVIAADLEMLNALRSAEDALQSCYNVADYPANGRTFQDEALRKVRSAIAKAEEH